MDARRLLDEYEKRADIGFYSEATASAYCEAASLYNHIFPSNAEKERVYALIEKAAHAARLDSEDDIITVIECVGGEYQGAHQGDTETAQRLLDEFLAKMVAIAESINIGDPQADETEMGPLCTQGRLT